MMVDGEDRLEILSKAILSYLAEHPDAGDTVKGIRQWWLPRIFAAASDMDVQRTLNRLVLSGKMKRLRSACGTVVYSRVAQSRG